jgi:hypothetical protein
MGAVISQYLFHIGLHIGLRQLSYFSTTSMKELFALQFKDQPKMLWIKLAPSNKGISFLTTLFGLGLAYSHNVTYRLFVALMEINPVKLLISLCISKVVGINSFYYEYS